MAVNLELNQRDTGKQTISPAQAKKAVIAGTFGNIMEWYDWAIYGYFAPVIGQLFFPATDALASLLLSFAVFAVGFIMRPLGALFFGPYSDRVGRKKALSLAVILMGISTFVMGILPTYEQIGILAPILLVIARLVQGLSAGGEWGSGTSFIVEYAPESKRGFYGSWQQFSTGAGLLVGSVVATVFTTIFSPQELSAWGWRIPFLLGIIVGIVGLYLRMRIDETPKYKEIAKDTKVSKKPLLDTLKNHPKEILIAIGFTIHWTVSYYLLLTYMPTYISKVVNLPMSLSLLSNVIVITFFISLVPVMGWLSDRLGRKPVLISSTIGFALLSYPLFSLIEHSSFVIILLSQMLLAIFEAAYSGPGPAAIAEVFPTKIRASALSVGYNISVAAFGGTAPFIATYLISATGDNTSPTYYVIACAVISMLVLFGIKETYKEPLK
ncbi:MFS transporter [Paenactinomyces guangxiensis]|uniref:Putative proline/betaine transporter n=1 Tax=Paenactinomyces guangxiensis TaxID=1490290 RepID=A0A7W1WR01_9BACL|nr:MFS transporter [Paenactinomyces guangxiensis]MBA4494324.1 MHS family MFS transporter [Paenactinomyces guangxiensis]MBH8590819.1 MHS family MFS transporter [Paenactinomyces guangxiensis]